MTARHTFDSVSDFTKRASQDLQRGREVHDLQPLIDDINAARKQVSSGTFSEWMEKFNQTEKKLRSTTSILGVDDSGNNLIVADANARKGLVISPLGAPVRTLSEQQIASSVPQHMIKVSDLIKGDGQFSLLMPPGLDTTGSGNFKVKNYYDQKVANKDGTITHNVSGQLSDSDWAMNIHAYESKSASAFTGNYTTTSDGKLLNSHIKYQVKYKTDPILGGYVNAFPYLSSNPTAPYRDAGESIYTPYVDTVYSTIKGAYLTMVDEDPALEHATTKSYETSTSANGSEQMHETPDDFNEISEATNSERYREFDAKRKKSDLKRDQAGNVIEVEHPPDDTGHPRKSTIVRDQSENPIAITEDDGTKWDKLSGDRWKKTAPDGTTSTFVGQVFVEDSGNIVFANGEEITLIPVQHLYVYRQVINKLGQVIAEDLGATHIDYQYGSDGKASLSKSTTTTSPNHTSINIETNPGISSRPDEMNFFE